MGGLPSGLYKGFGGLLLTALAACGGRSSPMDPDGTTIEANQPTGGSTSDGGSSAAGSGATATGAATGTGGKPGVPAGGSAAGGSSGAGTAGRNPSGGASSAGTSAGGGAGTAGAGGTSSSIFTNCSIYCNVAAQGPCPDGISNPECLSSCVNELSAQAPPCQTNGAALLRCLTAVYTNSHSCSEVDQLSLAKCSAQLTAYQNCVQPSIQPPPPPPPIPAPMVTCSSSGSSTNGICNLDVKCTSGAYYTVSCYQTGPAQSNCTCSASLPNGTGTGANFGLNENSTFACYDSLATCGFPEIGAK